jgi:hypothetical protein
MNNTEKPKFPIDSGWVETPKIRHRIISYSERKASSVPSTPLIQANHFDILSPSLSPSSSLKKHKHRKRKRTPQQSISSRNSPLSQELTRHDWDDHIVPINDEDTLPSPAIITESVMHSIQQETNQEKQQQQQQQPQLPDESLRQISFLDYLKDELTVADFDSAQELKRERVTNFLGVPAAIEKVCKVLLFIHDLKFNYIIVDGVWFFRLFRFIFIYLYHSSFKILFSILSLYDLYLQKYPSFVQTKRKVRVLSFLHTNKLTKYFCIDLFD